MEKSKSSWRSNTLSVKQYKYCVCKQNVTPCTHKSPHSYKNWCFKFQWPQMIFDSLFRCNWSISKLTSCKFFNHYFKLENSWQHRPRRVRNFQKELCTCTGATTIVFSLRLCHPYQFELSKLSSHFGILLAFIWSTPEMVIDHKDLFKVTPSLLCLLRHFQIHSHIFYATLLLLSPEPTTVFSLCSFSYNTSPFLGQASNFILLSLPSILFPVSRRVLNNLLAVSLLVPSRFRFPIRSYCF